MADPFVICFILMCLLLAGACFLQLAALSLRNFLRAKLANICRRLGNSARFGEILQEDETALRACEVAGWWSSTGASLCFAVILMSAEQPLWQLGFWLVGWLLMTTLLLQVLPWGVSRVAAERLLYRTWPVLWLLSRLLSPFGSLYRLADTMLHRIAGQAPREAENIETLADEIQSVVTEGEREGLLESRAGKMVYRLMELREEDVSSIMTPRTDIIAIDVHSTLEEARAQLLEAGHSRIPVIDESPDDVVGILYARDLLEQLSRDSQLQLREIVREPCYVPETMTIEDLLETMQGQRLHMAIVLDEYGGVAGLVTLEDILEEIVGEIADEFDEVESEQVQRINDNTLRVDARTRIDELNDAFDLGLPEDQDFDTLGGFVFSRLGHIPKAGESFERGPVRFTVTEVTARKILYVDLFSSQPWPHVSLGGTLTRLAGAEPEKQFPELKPLD